jgi:hypothetical protein
MSVLRSKFIDQLRLKGFSEKTVASYVSAVSLLSRHYKKSPLDLSAEDVNAYLLHLLQDRSEPATQNQKIYAKPFTPGGATPPINQAVSRKEPPSSSAGFIPQETAISQQQPTLNTAAF